MGAKKECRVDFFAWLGLACKHDPLAWKQLLCAALLMVCAFLVGMQALVVGIPLFLGLAFAFVLAFRRAWKLALKDPPWYLSANHIQEAQNGGKADND